jgi:hypothetical protein
MQSQDRVFLENALSSFIQTSINRVAHSGDMTYAYRITAAEVKAATNRQRLHAAVISEYQQFFANHHVAADYDSDFESFAITMDLNRCVLSPQQAGFLSAAMETFRSEHL